MKNLRKLKMVERMKKRKKLKAAKIYIRLSVKVGQNPILKKNLLN
jgi:hypothetical protein